MLIYFDYNIQINLIEILIGIFRFSNICTGKDKVIEIGFEMNERILTRNGFIISEVIF